MTYKEYNEMKEANARRIISLMESGVTFMDIDTTWVDEDVKIGANSVIEPCVQLRGNTAIGERCLIGQNSRIENSEIGSDVTIHSAVILESSVGSGTSVGPFAYIRPGTNIGESCKIGDFVEVKNSNLGKGTKASHLTYIGDADLGDDINLGCGVVFVNYDGKNKFRSTVEDGAFIGCNSNIVSPVTIGAGAYVGAGTTVTLNVPEDALCVGRSKQRNVEGWAKKSGLYSKKK